MIFRDGEFRRATSNKPMLFDGWGYVPVESTFGDPACPERAAPSSSGGPENEKQVAPERIKLHQVMR